MMKNQEWLMKKLGIRWLDATSSHLVTREEYDVKVHTDINVEAGMSNLTKLFLADKKSGSDEA
jgi:hypothetical protein